MSEAARKDDPIEHSSALEGLLTGLAVGAAAAIIGVAIVGTGGLAAVAIVGAGATLGAGIGELIGSLSFCTNDAGQIIEGSVNVFINGLAAARAHLSTVACDKHSGIKLVAEGSSTVYINGQPAARVGDRSTCDGKISAGSPNVFIGGGTQQTDEIDPEVPRWLHIAMLGIGIGSAVLLGAGPGLIALGLVGGITGGVGGHWLGGKIWGEGSDGQKLMAFGGAMLGGAAGGRGGKWFDARYQIKVEGLGSNFGNVRIQRRTPPLNDSVPTYKTPHQPLSRAQRNALNDKLHNRTITREEYQRLDWDRRFANRRATGVRQFWAEERARLQQGQMGTRNWNPQQKADILSGKRPQFNGETVQGHHKYNALDHPQLANDPKNIYPATKTEHFGRWHGGNWRNDTFGKPVNPDFPEEF